MGLYKGNLRQQIILNKESLSTAVETLKVKCGKSDENANMSMPNVMGRQGNNYAKRAVKE